MNTWIEVPNNTDFSIYNLPFGIFSKKGVSKRVGVAIGNKVIDLLACNKLNIFDLQSYRSRIGYVPQDPFLFSTTLRENLLWSKPEASEKEIWESCRLANADTFINDLPEKLDSVMGDRGVRLSGGQRQRIALARAIIRKPEIRTLQ